MLGGARFIALLFYLAGMGTAGIALWSSNEWQFGLFWLWMVLALALCGFGVAIQLLSEIYADLHDSRKPDMGPYLPKLPPP